MIFTLLLLLEFDKKIHENRYLNKIKPKNCVSNIIDNHRYNNGGHILGSCSEYEQLSRAGYPGSSVQGSQLHTGLG